MSLKDYTKTDRILLLVQTICSAPKFTLADQSVREILGNPSKAQYHKVINELTNDIGQRKAVLKKIRDEEGNLYFKLNHEHWFSFLVNQS